MTAKIALIDLSDNRIGGFYAFTSHLVRGFRAIGVAPGIYKPAKKDERKLRDYGYGMSYRNTSMGSLLRTAASLKTLIVCTQWKRYAEETVSLLDAGCGLVLHDPTEYAQFPELQAAIAGKRIFTIRPANQLLLASMGVDTHCILHPYTSGGGTSTFVKRRAVSYSRVDWDKHTEIIAAANSVLQPGHRIDIYGQENRLYVHHKLEAEWPDWATDYRGRFPKVFRAGAALASGYEYVVDMSAIHRDGGGSQYTYMEAWDAGAHLVINRAWLRDGDDAEGDEMVPGYNCHAVADAQELVARMRRDPDPEIVAGGRQSLEKHDAAKIAAEYWTVMGGQ